MSIEQERAAFEAWYEREYSEAVPCGFSPHGYYLDARVQLLFRCWGAARAALQSQDQVDAERYRCLSSMATQQADALGPIFRIDVRRTPQTLFNFDAAVDHARRAEGGGE